VLLVIPGRDLFLLLSPLDVIDANTNFGYTTITLAQVLVDVGCKGKVMTLERCLVS
jgi:predicted O-methyltransferase YrrM